MPEERSDEDWAAELARVHPGQWMSPEQLEPARLSYGTELRIVAKALTFKRVRMSFTRDKVDVPDKYPAETELATALAINASTFEIEHVFDGIFVASSLTALRDKSMAFQIAQQSWESSSILKRFREGHILAAYYGVQERETHYVSWIGECVSPNAAGEPPVRSRQSHMLRLAIVTAIQKSLDVQMFRAYLGGFRSLETATLLKTLHELRSANMLVSHALRSESLAWLAAAKSAPA